MPGHGEKLSRKQEALIAALLTAPSLEQAAKLVGINPVTAWRWMKQPAFAAAYRDAKRELVVHATTLLQRFASTAVSTLASIMVDSHALASSRVAAARTVLEMSLRGIELEELTARIEALELGGQGR
jgi:hypothetical protein